MADVSVIIPTYNRLWCLPKAIDSCRNTKCVTEIIVVDDGSTDGTWQWLQKQPNLITVRQVNQGQTWAINAGTAIATGRYLRFLDSDDYLTEGTIDKQYDKAVDTGAELVYSRVDFLNHDSGKVSIQPDLPLWEDFLSIQLGNQYGSHFLGMLFHKRLVNAVPRRPDFAFREDRMFLLEVGMLKPKLAVVPGCAGYWVQHQGQMQGNYSGHKSQVTNWQHLQIYKRILGKLSRLGELTPRRIDAAVSILWPLANWTAISHIKEAEGIFSWIKELKPDFIIPDASLKGRLFRVLGFSGTQKLLRVFRFLKYGWQ